jgi:hypothetical protein
MTPDMKGVRSAKATSCNPTLYIDLLKTINEVDEVLYNNYIPTNLHLDTRNIPRNKVSQDMDLLHMSKQAHLTEKFAEVYEILEVQAS